ncbi:MAG: histidine triad nucleotide-binding protein [Acidaminobacteraceae bacterium]
MSDCIFCKIVNKEIPANIVYEDDKILVFHDLSPVAPVHVLVIPKIHIDSLNTLDESSSNTIGYLMSKVKEIAKKLGVDKSGFRIISNTGDEGGQTVGHVHFHLVGGRQMKWPPG